MRRKSAWALLALMLTSLVLTTGSDCNIDVRGFGDGFWINVTDDDDDGWSFDWDD